MLLTYQISLSSVKVHNIAKQVNERIKETVGYYVNHFYKLILAKILGGEFTVMINFKKLDEEKVDIFLEEGTIVRVSRNANDKKCLGPFSDFRNGIVTSVLKSKGDTRYLIKVIGEKSCAQSDMPTDVYDSEKTYLRALFPTSKKQIFLYGNGFPIINEEQLHSLSSMLYSAGELEVGSIEERYKIISETMDELESLLGITIVKSGPYSSCSLYEGKLADYVYKISWDTPKEEQKQDQDKKENPWVMSSNEEDEEEYAELYDLWQLSSTPEKELRRLGLYIPEKEEDKADNFPTIDISSLDFDKIKVLEEKHDKPFS